MSIEPPPSEHATTPAQASSDSSAPSIDLAASANSAPTAAGVARGEAEPAHGGAASGGDADAWAGEGAGERLAVDDEASPTLAGDQLRGALEAILLVIDEPVASAMLASVLMVTETAVLDMLRSLRADYDAASRGFELREVGPGWRLYTRASFAPYVERFVLDGQQARLTQAALETLAVVAYRQPVSRSRVSAVRGVNVDGVMRTLVSRGLVEEAGAEHDTGALLYRTTAYFLERLGLRNLDELPNLANFLPESTTIEQLEAELSTEGRDV